MATERAVLAGGCFWGMQDLIRKMPGVVSTRVGYTGGDVPNATYRNHGTHAEAIEIVFDPAVMSYRRLLEFFFQIHDPTTLNRQRQRPRHVVPLGDLLRLRSTAARVDQHDQGRRGLRPLAGQGGHGSRTRGSVLAGRSGTSGLPGAPCGRLHLPLRAAELGFASACRRLNLHAVPRGAGRSRGRPGTQIRRVAWARLRLCSAPAPGVPNP